MLLNNLKIKYKLWLVAGVGIACISAVMLVASVSLRHAIDSEKQLKTRNVVEVAYKTLEYFHGLVKSGAMSEQDAKNAALSAIKSMRYDESEYFWINDMHPTMVMHPINPDLDGKDLTDYKDPEGTRLFVEFVETVKKQNAGFVSYLWAKPGFGKPVRKVSYVKGFMPWEWVIGSGIYLDDVDALFWKDVRNNVIVLIIIFALFGLLVWVITRNIRPLRKVMSIMQKVSKGDLTEKIEGITSKDEIGEMAAYTNEMVDSLSSMLGQIKTNADQLVAASSQIAASAEQTSKNSESSASAVEEMTSTMHEMSTNIQSVAKNTQKQASSVVETSSSIEQMVASIKRVAENVKRLVSISDKSRGAVSVGATAVDKASSGMGEINTAIQQSAQTIMSLGSRTEEMAKIVEVIDDIAEQTNLLALNAAIEAARAGEKGMGFAVVAEEVRKLAERSAKSTREIADLIKSVSNEAQKAVGNMTRSTGIVEVGLVSSREVIQALQGIESAVDEVSKYASEIGAATHEQSSGSEQIGKAMVNLNEVTQEISTAAEEQSSGAEQVVKAIEKIREMVQQNASSAIELASSAEQLSRQSGGLQGLVERFALNGNGRKN